MSPGVVAGMERSVGVRAPAGISLKKPSHTVGRTGSGSASV